MLDFIKPVGVAAVSFFKTRAALQLENVALHHQLVIVRRSVPKHLRLTRLDRLILASLYRLWPRIVGSILVVRPKTVVRWHREGFRLFWRWKCGGKSGRPEVPPEVRGLIREMSLANSLWGAPRIHGELLKLGFDLGQTTVATYMVKAPRGGLSKLAFSRSVLRIF